MKLMKMHWVGIISGLLIAIASLLVYFLGNRDLNLLLFLLGISVVVVALPFVMGVVLQSREEEQKAEMFLEFARNLAEGVSTGTPVSKSIINMKNRNYGALSPHVSKLANQIALGIPVGKSLDNFARDVDSPVVSRAIALIREAERAGGEIGYILESVAKSIAEVEKLKKERRAAIYNLVVQGYIVFFIFIGIMLVMEFKILPITADIGLIGAGGPEILGAGSSAAATSASLNAEQLSRPFFYLLLIQGLFAGLTIGKLAEGSIKEGIKHSFILMVASYLISTGARLFLG